MTSTTKAARASTAQTNASAITASTKPEARNPHCEKQWPHNMGWHPVVARLVEASCAASVIAELLHTEEFKPNRTEGLRFALRICLEEINLTSEFLQDCEINSKEAAQ